MKNTIFLIIILVLFFSCNKSDDTIQLKELSGDWILTSSCGGFSGACSYPDQSNYKSTLITEDRIVQKVNGQVEIDETYEITKLEISEVNYPYEKNYELTLSNGQIIEMSFFQKMDLLIIGDNMFLDRYKRK